MVLCIARTHSFLLLYSTLLDELSPFILLVGHWVSLVFAMMATAVKILIYLYRFLVHMYKSFTRSSRVSICTHNLHTLVDSLLFYSLIYAKH